jgi:hypothetical protein
MKNRLRILQGRTLDDETESIGWLSKWAESYSCMGGAASPPGRLWSRKRSGCEVGRSPL